MAEAPYTKNRHYQFRGPTDSADYNDRIEENYRDLVFLYNSLRILSDEYNEGYGRLLRDQVAISRMLEQLKAHQDILDAADNTLSFYSSDQIDNSRFTGGTYQIAAPDQCSHDNRHGLLTLPEVENSSLSKLSFVSSDNSVFVPSTLETRIEGKPGTADSTGATIDSNEPEVSVARITGRVWERNVVVSSPNGNGAELSFFLKAPTDLFTTDKSNALLLHPYPVFGCDIIEVAYTSNADVMMDDGDGYTPLNSDSIHQGNTQAVGAVPPGGWPNDVALDAGPKFYHFEPTVITGLRIKLRQRNAFKEAGNYIYTYGFSDLDLRYNKYLDSGKVLIRFDAPTGHTISHVNNVIPQMWNVAEAVQPLVFSYRLIWETSYNSGTYTLNPVALSKRVWVEVSLTKTPGGGTPALSGLTIQYT